MHDETRAPRTDSGARLGGFPGTRRARYEGAPSSSIPMCSDIGTVAEGAAGTAALDLDPMSTHLGTERVEKLVTAHEVLTAWVETRRGVALRGPSVLSTASYDDLFDPSHPRFDTPTRCTHHGPSRYDARLPELIERAKAEP